MKKIFMIGYSAEKGGVESYINNVCSLLKAKYEIVLRWPTMVVDGKEWVVPKNRHNFLKYRLFWRKFFRENKFDVVYYNTCDLLSIDMLKYAKAAGVPVRIIHSHSADNNYFGSGILVPFHKWEERKNRKTLHRYATDLLACSKTAGDWMFDSRQYTIINNGIHLGDYAFSEEKRSKVLQSLGDVTANKVVACLGRLAPPKNSFKCLSIFAELCRQHDDALCLFIGDGEYRERLEQKVAELGLQKKVLFTGAVDNVNEWLSLVDAILMPSNWEGLPFALVEAQAAGIHSLVSDRMSTEANITGLVEYEKLDASDEDWAKRLYELALMPREDVSQSLTAAGYSIENTAKVIEQIIEAEH